MSTASTLNIVIQNLGSISKVAEHKVKFILLDNGVLLFGKVEWHKDLMDAFVGDKANRIVIAAGSLPENVGTADLGDDAWGGWKSTGYKVLTPLEYRDKIHAALLPYNKEIEVLSKYQN